MASIVGYTIGTAYGGPVGGMILGAAGAYIDQNYIFPALMGPEIVRQPVAGLTIQTGEDGSDAPMVYGQLARVPMHPIFIAAPWTVTEQTIVRQGKRETITERSTWFTDALYGVSWNKGGVLKEVSYDERRVYSVLAQRDRIARFGSDPAVDDWYRNIQHTNGVQQPTQLGAPSGFDLQLTRNSDFQIALFTHHDPSNPGYPRRGAQRLDQIDINSIMQLFVREFGTEPWIGINDPTVTGRPGSSLYTMFRVTASQVDSFRPSLPANTNHTTLWIRLGKQPVGAPPPVGRQTAYWKERFWWIPHTTTLGDINETGNMAPQEVMFDLIYGSATVYEMLLRFFPFEGDEAYLYRQLIDPTAGGLIEFHNGDLAQTTPTVLLDYRPDLAGIPNGGRERYPGIACVSMLDINLSSAGNRMPQFQAVVSGDVPARASTATVSNDLLYTVRSILSENPRTVFGVGLESIAQINATPRTADFWGYSFLGRQDVRTALAPLFTAFNMGWMEGCDFTLHYEHAARIQTADSNRWFRSGFRSNDANARADGDAPPTETGIQTAEINQADRVRKVELTYADIEFRLYTRTVTWEDDAHPLGREQSLRLDRVSMQAGYAQARVGEIVREYQAEWRQFSCRLGPRFLGVQPGDFLILTDASPPRSFRVSSVTIGPDWIVDVMGIEWVDEAEGSRT